MNAIDDMMLRYGIPADNVRSASKGDKTVRIS
jgi:hypothetical protein